MIDAAYIININQASSNKKPNIYVGLFKFSRNAADFLLINSKVANSMIRFVTC